MPTEYSTEVSLNTLEGSIDKSTTKKVVMLANLKINQKLEESLALAVNREHDLGNKDARLLGLKAAAAKYFQMMIDAVRVHISTIIEDQIIDDDVSTSASDAINSLTAQSAQEFISAIINTANISGPITNESIEESVAYHANLLLNTFCDGWLPHNIVSLKLSQIAACVAVILKAQSQNSVQTHSTNTVSSNTDNLAPAEAAIPAPSVQLPLPAAVPTDLGQFIAPASDAPTALPTRPVRGDLKLILSGAAIGLIGVALGFTQRERVITRSRHTTSVATPNAHTPSPSSIVANPPAETTQEREGPITPPPVIISASSAFGIEDLVHSRLEEGVRRALLTQTEALGHCLANPNDAVYLAHGLRRPITDQLRRANWQVGIAPGQRGITITWTDDGRCSDFEASGWEINDAGTHSTIYPATIIVIATDIATIARNQKMFHVLPTIGQ